MLALVCLQPAPIGPEPGAAFAKSSESIGSSSSSNSTSRMGRDESTSSSATELVLSIDMKSLMLVMPPGAAAIIQRVASRCALTCWPVDDATNSLPYTSWIDAKQQGSVALWGICKQTRLSSWVLPLFLGLAVFGGLHPCGHLAARLAVGQERRHRRVSLATARGQIQDPLLEPVVLPLGVLQLRLVLLHDSVQPLLKLLLSRLPFVCLSFPGPFPCRHSEYQLLSRTWSVRPAAPVSAAPAAWWKHACAAVLAECRQWRPPGSMRQALQRRRQYIALYKAVHCGSSTYVWSASDRRHKPNYSRKP